MPIPSHLPLFKGTPGNLALIIRNLNNQHDDDIFRMIGPSSRRLVRRGGWDDPRDQLTAQLFATISDRDRYEQAQADRQLNFLIVPISVQTEAKCELIVVQMDENYSSLTLIAHDFSRDQDWLLFASRWQILFESLKRDGLIIEPEVDQGQDATMKLMITHADEFNLRGLGYSDEDICKMKPAEAETILNGEIRKMPLADPNAIGYSGTSPPSLLQSKEFSLPSEDFGKRTYSGYNLETAKRIADAFPQAQQRVDEDPNFATKFTVALIADCAAVSSTLCGRYINVFRDAGMNNVFGVPLPPKKGTRKTKRRNKRAIKRRVK